MIGFFKALFARGEHLSPPQAQARMKQGAILVDVRESHEFANGHAAGAKLLPLSRIRAEGSSALDSLRLPKDSNEILLVCQSGLRSRIARSLLAKGSQRRYINVDGGMAAWNAHGLP